MKINKTKLIADLITQTNSNIVQVENFKKLTDQILNFKESHDKWSILECIEHLNLYGDFYLPEIKKSITSANGTSDTIFKSGLIGNYFVNSMIPKEQIKKIKTFRDKNPTGSILDKSVLNRFQAQQVEFLELIEKAKNVNITKAKTAISISKLIRLRLGDTFRFVVAHNDRHLVQAQNVLSDSNR